ncbi:MAG: hypothetical protein ACI9ON_002727 [Limisphaerales bacterium]|jgi:hypothetical protein
MSWDAIGAIGELAGALGVVASLVYLATQIRHSTSASNVEAKLTTTGLQAGIVDMLIADPALNELLMRGITSTDDFTSEEFQRFSNLCMKTFWFYSAAHYQLQTGMLSDDNWFETKSLLDWQLSGAGVRGWWRKAGSKRFQGKFSEFIENEIRLVERQGET